MAVPTIFRRAQAEIGRRTAGVSLLTFLVLAWWLIYNSPRTLKPTPTLEPPQEELLAATLACQQNPFSSNGHLNMSLSNTDDLQSNRWIPFAPNCSTPSLMPSVVRRARLPWLEDRTVVLFGSSVDRNHLTHFCELVNGKFERIGPSHPQSPLRLPFFFVEPGHTVLNTAQPHICRVDEYRLQLIFVFHYGLEVEDHWSQFGQPNITLQHHWTPPGRFEDRLNALLVPLLATLGVEHNRIDLLEVSAYEWDLAYWQQVSPLRNSGSEMHLRDGWNVHLPFFTRRLAEAADLVLRTFPCRRTKILWRVPHVTGRDDPAPRYAAAMAQATRFVFGESNATLRAAFELDETGAMLRGGGKSAWMADHTHPAKIPHGVVWSDYMLWHLRRSVTGEM